jgi:pimeloyl-ACP methyl ester carboxylesterase
MHIGPRTRRALLIVGIALVVIPCLGLATFRMAAAWRESMPRPEAAPPTGKYVQAADVRLFYQEEGPADGPPVVLIHGTGAWSEIWRGTMHNLARAGYRAIALDMPPFGYTVPPANADYGDEAQARRILGALDSLHLSKVILVGHSFGGRPTMQATFLAPERVEALVLVDAALGLQAKHTGGSPILKATLGMTSLRNALVASTFTNPLLTRRLFSMLVAEKSAVTTSRVVMLQQPFVVEGATPRLGEWLLPFATTSESTMASDRTRYPELTMPTLVLWGAKDEITPVAQGRDIASLIPGAAWAELPNSGHIPAIEDPAGFDAAVLQFLRERVPTQTAAR